MSERPDSLIATALRHGLRADMSVEDAAADLVRMASGEPRRIEQAIDRLARGAPQRPGLVGEYAREALRLALAQSRHPSVPAGIPG